MLLVTTLWSLHVRAADNGSAAQCASVSDDHARLQCYDSVFRSGGASHQPAPSGASGAATPAAVAAAAAAPAPRSNPEAEFGLTEAAKQARSPEAAPRAPESISGKVSHVARGSSGEFIVTLDDGQVWTQLDSYPVVRVAPGDMVTIKKASLGSYLLVTPSKVATRVRRTKNE